MRMFKRFVMTAAVVTMGMGVSVAQAQNGSGPTLADLINQNDTVTSGDKLFSDFTYTATGDMPGAENIVVNAFEENGDFGLEFVGAFLDNAGGDASEAFITYKVTVTDPNNEIVGANLSGDIALEAVANGGGGTVIETFVPDSDEVAQIFNTSGGGTQLTDSVTFDPGFTMLNVQKDIVLDAGDQLNGLSSTGFAAMTFVRQTFEQDGNGGGVIIPEPAMVGMLSLGALGLVRRRRA